MAAYHFSVLMYIKVAAVWFLYFSYYKTLDYEI